MLAVWLLAVPGGARVPPPRSNREALLRSCSWTHEIAREGPRRGQEVRPTVLELPCGGGGRTGYRAEHRCSLKLPAQATLTAADSFGRLTAAFRGSSIGSSVR